MKHNIAILGFILIVIIFFSVPSFASEIANPKIIDKITLEIEDTGSLDVSGHVSYANLSLYLPQETIQNIEVSGADSWKYTYDKFNNKQLLLEWNNPTDITYSVKTTITKNSENFKLKGNEKTGTLPTGSRFLRETNNIIFDNNIRKLGYQILPDKTLEEVAELAIFIHNYINYDFSLVGEKKSSTWVYNNKRGVCAEYSTLMAAILRSAGIPAKYISGYAYSPKENKFIGHAWIEVLVSTANGEKWIPFDATWLEGGFIDATHIKTAELDDNNQTETLSYKGTGTISWSKNKEEYTIIDYNTKKPVQIALSKDEPSLNSYGYLKADLTSDRCLIEDLKVSTCIDPSGKEALKFYNDSGKFWLCKSDTKYYIAKPDKQSSFTCPVTVYDQMNSSAKENIIVSGSSMPPDIYINGPDTALINQAFKLEPSVTGILFCTDNQMKKIQDLSGKEYFISRKPGTYKFYLYKDKSFASKTVSVVEKNEFEISMDVPEKAGFNQSFIINATIRNLLNKNKNAALKIEIDSFSEQSKLSFKPNETKQLSFNLSSSESGIRKITLSIMSDTLTSYSSYINIAEQPKPWYQLLIDTILAFFQNIAEAVAGLF